MTLNRWHGSSGNESRFLEWLNRAMVGCALAMGILGQATTANPQSAKPENKNAPNLAREVRHQLTELPFYSPFDFITFDLDGKKVTLSGQVVRPSLKKDALTAIRSLEDVEAVVDQIEVLPSSPEDNELRRAIYRAIFEDSTLASYAVQEVPTIHIIVKNGSVTLEGTTKSGTDKNLAAQRAGSVPNVAGVKNNLKVQVSQHAAE